MAPKKIFIQPDEHDRWWEGDKPNDMFIEYIRKDAHDDIVKTAEDHAFLAGAEWEKERINGNTLDAYVVESFNPVAEPGKPYLHGITILYEDENKPYLLAGEHVKLKILK